jgi:hypothetical protein
VRRLKLLLTTGSTYEKSLGLLLVTRSSTMAYWFYFRIAFVPLVVCKNAHSTHDRERFVGNSYALYMYMYRVYTQL